MCIEVNKSFCQGENYYMEQKGETQKKVLNILWYFIDVWKHEHKNCNLFDFFVHAIQTFFSPFGKDKCDCLHVFCIFLMVEKWNFKIIFEGWKNFSHPNQNSTLYKFLLKCSLQSKSNFLKWDTFRYLDIEWKMQVQSFGSFTH